MSPKYIDLSPDEASSLIERVRSRTLDEKDYELVVRLIETVLILYQALSEKGHSIQRLLRRFFGVKTESTKNVLKGSQESEKAAERSVPPAQSDATKKKGHGRNGAAAYSNAPRIPVPHECLKAGQLCPLCLRGKLYPLKPPAVIVRISGHAPVEAKIYECERFRCNGCLEVFTASLPEGVAGEKYDESARAIIACLKYGSGFPFYRLEGLQESMQTPLPASTQWDEVEKLADTVHPVYPALIGWAAQADVVHNDDTTMRILALAKEIASTGAERTGIFTTGIVSILDGYRAALFFTGNHHAGENIRELLKLRAEGLPPPVQMCDALSWNAPEDLKAIFSNCLTHARRNFVDVHSSFPEECAYLLEALGKIYHHDAMAKERNLSKEERLQFHQIHSGPVMDELKAWMNEQIDQKKVEPNSGLGKAIEYMRKRWEKFTLFLRIPGAPLDNNICEQLLKRAVLHRKNSLFYRTEHGAYIGDMLMSLIATCSLNSVNPFHYLVALQRHAPEVRKHPGQWLPWNYQQRLNPPPS